MQQHVAYDASQQSFDGNSVSPAQCPGHQRQQGRKEDQQGHRADSFSSRGHDFARFEPAGRQQPNHQWNNENGNARVLKQEITDQGAKEANPITCRARGQRRCCGIQRWIMRRIADQGKEKEDGGDKQKKPDQLIEPPVSGRRKNPQKILHEGVLSAADFDYIPTEGRDPYCFHTTSGRMPQDISWCGGIFPFTSFRVGMLQRDTKPLQAAAECQSRMIMPKKPRQWQVKAEC